MKKFFWILITILVLVGGFWGYLWFFNNELGYSIASYISRDVRNGVENIPSNCDITQEDPNLDKIEAKLGAIQAKLDVLSQGINSTQPTNQAGNFPQSIGSTTVSLFYFNEVEDNKLPTIQQLNKQSILPINRVIESSDNLISDTIKLLIEGSLTPQESQNGFSTEFPHPQFALQGMKLEQDGTLYLQFSEVPGFTSGGSARMFLMQQSIEKTALQFPEVKKVIFIPETLFQP